MDVKLIFALASLHFLALISPGPDLVLTLRNSLYLGRKMGLMTALGFGLGIAVHISYSLAGLAVLLKEFPAIYALIRYAGASYLIWLGLSALWALRQANGPQDIQAGPSVHSASARQCLTQGFLTNILNPKAGLFILGLFSTMVPPQTPPSTLVVSGGIMVLMTILWFSIVSWLFSTQKIRMMYLKAEGILNAVFALFFIGVGVALILN